MKPNRFVPGVPPPVPAHVDVWTIRTLSHFVGVSEWAVKSQAKAVVPECSSRTQFTPQQAQRIVVRIYNFSRPGGNKPVEATR